MLRFVQPDDCYRQEYTDMMDEWHASGGGISPWRCWKLIVLIRNLRPCSAW